jgi:beta-phosphoglucomutase
MTAKLKGVVFDMDGVIIESEHTHYSAICEAMGERMNQTYETFLSKCTGGDERFAMGRLAQFSGIEYDESLFQEWSKKKAVAYQRLVGESATAMPGAIELVSSVAEKFPIGLATGSRRSDVEAAFSTLAGGKLNGLFQSIVTSDDVAKPKPDPATYAKAVDGLGIPPQNCLAIDDSPNGVSSAKKAGMKVLGITAIHDSLSLRDAEWHLHSLEEVTLGDLINLFEGES